MKRRTAAWVRFGFLAAMLVACSSTPDGGNEGDAGGSSGGPGSGATSSTGGSGTAGSSAGTASSGNMGGSASSTGGSAAAGGNASGGAGSESGGTGGTDSESGGAGGSASGGTGAGGSGGSSGASGGASASGGTGGTAVAAGGTAGGGTGGGSGTAGTAGTAGTGGAPNPGNLKATMVVRGAGTATAGDNVMIGRIKAHGFSQVTVVSDAAVTAQSVVGSDLVVISSSAESGPLKSKLKDIAIPVLCVEDAEFSLMGMATEGDHTADISSVTISTPASPLVGTLTGNVTFSSKPGELGWGTVAATALKGATIPGNAAHVTVFGYEKGAQMVGMTAPARRAGFAIRETLAANLNADGLKLFDSILEWVMK